MPNLSTESYFSSVPTLDNSRSIFKRPKRHATSFNVGECIPNYWSVLYPGDTVKISTSKIVRMQTMLSPVFDNLYLDQYFFFVPMRLVWDHTKQFFGENSDSPWIPQTQYKIPSISSPPGGFAPGTLADYVGLPVNVEWSNQSKFRPMALLFRAYAKCIDHFFRDENLDDPLNIPTGDANQTGSNGSDYINDIANGGRPFIAARYHDYFSSCLPSPQKNIYGGEVTFPLISGNMAPVGTRNVDNAYGSSFGNTALHLKDLSGTVHPSLNKAFNIIASGTATSVPEDRWLMVGASESALPSGNAAHMVPVNLWADLSSTVGAVTVNQLRMAILLQSFYERVSVSGSRYGELISGIWSVSNPDSRLQDPEYLGGNRIALNVNEVINQAQSASDYLGDLGAMSRTVDTHEDVEFSSTEHGFLLGICVARYDNTFSQSMPVELTRLDPLQWYNPFFANLGAMPVYQFEIDATTENLESGEIFGFNEAWADLRYDKDIVTSELRPGVPNSLSSWHFADYYDEPPTLSSEWLRVDKTNVDRTLAVQSSIANQIFADFYFDCTYTRVLPMYSIPSFNPHF